MECLVLWLEKDCVVFRRMLDKVEWEKFCSYEDIVWLSVEKGCLDCIFMGVELELVEV